MNPIELDEAQGLTDEAVKAYALSHGWILEDRRARGHRWTYGTREDARRSSERFLPGRWQNWIDSFLREIAEKEKRGLQALLRDLNPRWRGPGYPNDEAAKAHGHQGWWLFMHPDGDLHTAQAHIDKWGVRFYWENGLMGEPRDDSCMWWPCDKNGTRVRWPEKNGVML